MKTPALLLAAALAAATSLSACKTNDETGADGAAATEAGASGTAGASTGTSGSSTGSTTGGSAGAGGSSGTGGIPALVNVNLENVLNNLSVDLKIDRANIPVNAQVPIDVAANVCGVSVSALSASITSGQASCTAKTTSPALAQTVQQQVAAGGNVGGGAQTMGSPTENQF
jgi:hypothetical protein